MLSKKRLAACLFCLSLLASAPLIALEAPSAASVQGKYSRLTQVLTCPQDQASYGNFSDYGYWGGGAWCGQTGEAGYWVWVTPNWYVWKNQEAPNKPPPTPDIATVSGKYSALIQTLHCPADRAAYGQFRDYGYWSGGAWCGHTGEAGYWVWVAPNWYVWKRQQQ